MAYDILEQGGADIRGVPLRDRRARLEALATALPDVPALKISPLIRADSWDALSAEHKLAPSRAAEGIMLKRLESPYGVGRQRGDWWKWKVDPFHFDGVLIYAQVGHGRRAGLYTDYTFGVWDQPPGPPGAGVKRELVPVTKAYSGLTDEEIAKVDAFVRRNSKEKFGPVKVVKPELVFEIAFERIAQSKRHRSGLAVRFPRMARWRTDKKPEEADTLDYLKALLKEQDSRVRASGFTTEARRHGEED